MVRGFVLPTGWYRSTITHLVDEELPPLLGDLTKETAWRYLYAIVLWSEDVDGESYLHLNDQLGNKSGRALARRGAEYLAEHLTPQGYDGDLLNIIDFIGDEYRRERERQAFGPPKKKRDPNITGAAFEATLQVLIERLCEVTPARTPQLRTLEGFELAPVGYHSRPDLALFGARDFRLLISTKWTLRKERIGTYLHEAYFYKQRRPDLQVAFVVSDFNLNILQWLSADPLVDRVYHTHLPMLLDAHPPFPDVPTGGAVDKTRLLASTREMSDFRRYLELQWRVFDLSQLFEDIDSLRKSDAPIEPESENEFDGIDDTDS